MSSRHVQSFGLDVVFNLNGTKHAEYLTKRGKVICFGLWYRHVQYCGLDVVQST